LFSLLLWLQRVRLALFFRLGSGSLESGAGLMMSDIFVLAFLEWFLFAGWFIGIGWFRWEGPCCFDLGRTDGKEEQRKGQRERDQRGDSETD
jgi:hypothetical protein